MKKVLFTLVAGTVLIAMHSLAQTITSVTPGNGTLAAAIVVAAPGDILQLTGGAEYTHSSGTSIASLTKPLTIQVTPGSTQKAIIKLAESASPSSSYYYFYVKDGAALTLKGLEIHGLLNGVAVAKEMLYFDGRPDPSTAKIGTFRFENCVFHDFADNIVHGMKDDYDRGLIQDSVFIDNVIVYNAQAFLQYKHVKLRHIEMKNSTIYKIQGLGLKIGKIGYRCILANGGAKPYTSLYPDSTITPTGFIDHCTMNDMGDIHGHIQVDDAFQKITISNCIVSNQDRAIGGPYISVLGSLQPALYLQDPRPDTAFFIQNVCFWKTATQADAGSESWVGGPPWHGYIFQDTLSIDPNYKDTANGDFTLPDNSPLQTCGTDGGPIGDPRWAQSATQVSQANGTIPSNFQLSQNYPNPFNPVTSIEYRVPSETNVKLIIFDFLGREVATLVNEEKQSGRYSVTWDGTRYPSGVYFYRLTAGDFIEIKKVILLK